MLVRALTAGLLGKPSGSVKCVRKKRGTLGAKLAILGREVECSDRERDDNGSL